MFVPGNTEVDPDPNQYVDNTTDVEVEQVVRPHMAPGPSTSDVGGNDTNLCHFDGYEDVDLSQEMHGTSYILPNTTTHAQTPFASKEIGVGRHTSTQAFRSSIPSGVGGSGRQGDAGPSTTRRWKRKKASEQTRDEMHIVMSHFIGAIGEDRKARQEEHNQLIQFYNRRHSETLTANMSIAEANMFIADQATRSARQTGVDIARALTYMADAIRDLADSACRSPYT